MGFSIEGFMLIITADHSFSVVDAFWVFDLDYLCVVIWTLPFQDGLIMWPDFVLCVNYEMFIVIEISITSHCVNTQCKLNIIFHHLNLFLISFLSSFTGKYVHLYILCYCFGFKYQSIKLLSEYLIIYN